MANEHVVSKEQRWPHVSGVLSEWIVWHEHGLSGLQGQLAVGELAKPLSIWTRFQRSGKDQVWTFMKDWSTCVQALATVASSSQMFTTWGYLLQRQTSSEMSEYLINTLRFWVKVVRESYLIQGPLYVSLCVCPFFISPPLQSGFRDTSHWRSTSCSYTYYYNSYVKKMKLENLQVNEWNCEYSFTLR